MDALTAPLLLLPIVFGGYVFISSTELFCKYSISLSGGNTLYDVLNLLLISLVVNAVALVFYILISFFIGSFITDIQFGPMSFLFWVLFPPILIASATFLGWAFLHFSVHSRSLTAWVYGPLAKAVMDGGNWIRVSIVTSISEGENRLCYLGTLENVRFSKRKNIEYITLSIPQRFYLRMNKTKASVASHIAFESDNPNGDILFIPGDQILNANFFAMPFDDGKDT